MPDQSMFADNPDTHTMRKHAPTPARRRRRLHVSQVRAVVFAALAACGSVAVRAQDAPAVKPRPKREIIRVPPEAQEPSRKTGAHATTNARRVSPDTKDGAANKTTGAPADVPRKPAPAPAASTPPTNAKANASGAKANVSGATTANASGATTPVPAAATKAVPPINAAPDAASSGAKRESNKATLESQEGVRARRVGTADASADSPVSSSGSSVSSSTVVAPSRVAPQLPVQGDAAMKYGSASKPDASAPLPPADAELETLRTRAREVESDAERARLQHAVVNRLVETEHQTEAIDELRAMMREERFDPPHFFNIGNALARLGDSHTAVEAYRKAVGQRRGNYARAQNNLGVVLIRLGRWEEASEALSAALRLENGNYPEASYNMGRVYALRGEAGLAIREWTHTLYIRPDHADAAVALARTLAADGQHERALAVLDSFSTRTTARGAIVPRLIAVTRGEIVAASNVAVERDADSGSSSDDRDTTGAKRTGASSSASATSRTAHGRLPAMAQQDYALLQRARAAREAGRYEEAETLYRSVLAGRGGYFPPANLELGYALINMKRSEEAIELLVPVTTKDAARYPAVFHHLGRLYEHLGQLPLAAEAFTRASQLYGDDNAQFLLDLSRIREKQNDWPNALTAMEAYVAATEKQGVSPDWARERIAHLRRKVAAAAAPSPAP